MDKNVIEKLLLEDLTDSQKEAVRAKDRVCCSWRVQARVAALSQVV